MRYGRHATCPRAIRLHQVTIIPPPARALRRHHAAGPKRDHLKHTTKQFLESRLAIMFGGPPTAEEIIFGTGETFTDRAAARRHPRVATQDRGACQ